MAISLANGKIAQRLDYIQKQVPQVRDRALASVLRGILPEASRLISADILNLSPRQISPYLKATASKTDNSITVSASRHRLPLQAFKPSVSARGVTVTTWKDRGAQYLPHAFKRPDGKAGVWQRVPFTGTGKSGGGDSGLVHRLPIVERKGPSMHRIFQGRTAPTGGHGDIAPRLSVYAQARLAEEVARMTKAGL